MIYTKKLILLYWCTVLIFESSSLYLVKVKWRDSQVKPLTKRSSHCSPSTCYLDYISKHTHHGDNCNGNPVAGGSGLNQQNQLQQQNVVNPGNQNQNMDAACLAQQILANTNVTLKTEMVTLPEFCGQPVKDTISAMEFMARINECQVTNEWNDTTTISNFRLAL